MSFTRARTIKGNMYLYEETRYREGKKVKSRSRSLGPILGGLFKVSPENVGMRQLERQAAAADAYREKLAADRAHLASLEKLGTELAKEFQKEAASKSDAPQGAPTSTPAEHTSKEGTP